MKTLNLALALIVLALSDFAVAQTKGPNGGIVVTVDDHPIEFVHRGQDIVFYLGDHDGKPLPTKGLQARATVQDRGKTTTVSLAPADPNMFVGKLAAPLAAGARVVFSTRFQNHTVQVRFAPE
jgi:hypothetical protein